MATQVKTGRSGAELLRWIQIRAARVAVGPSAVRNQGAPGTVHAAREYLGNLSPALFATTSGDAFKRSLDSSTRGLQKALPAKSASWGLSRKLLNIYLRECLYTHYLRDSYGLARSESYLEVPLDSITGGMLRDLYPDLPRWPGVKHLDPATSALYQDAAETEAKTRHKDLARIHLDAMWWGTRRT